MCRSLFSSHSQLVIHFETLGKQPADIALSLRNIATDNELAVNSHVIERI